MHAVLPQQCVIHVHSVSTLGWAVRADARARLAERLFGLRWKWIPYVPSGLPLALAVQKASSATPHPEIFILGNHGLVVSGDNCDATEHVLSEVERRLSIQPRAAAEPHLSILRNVGDHSCFRLPDLAGIHTLGTDAVSRRIFRGGVLYPCQAIFLGAKPPFIHAPRHRLEA